MELGFLVQLPTEKVLKQKQNESYEQHYIPAQGQPEQNFFFSAHETQI